MSKDWTPKEYYYADRAYNFRSSTVTMTDSNGKEFRIGPSKEDLEKYRNLAFLGEGVLKRMREEGVSEEHIGLFEKELTTIIENEKIGIPASNWQRDDIADSLRITALWYEGKLDPSFYYRETNDEEFVCQAILYLKTLEKNADEEQDGPDL